MPKQPQARAPIQWRLVLKWAAATALGYVFGQTAGVMAGFLVGGLILPVAGDVLGGLLAIAVVGAVTGALVALAQRLFARDDVDLPGRWVLLSALGWTIGYPLATAVASTLSSVIDPVWASSLYWALIGVSIGAAQWWLLRRDMPRAVWWITASTVAWLFAPPIAALAVAALLGLGIDPGESAVALGVSALSGAAAGAITGIALSWLLQQSAALPD